MLSITIFRLSRTCARGNFQRRKILGTQQLDCLLVVDEMRDTVVD